MKKLILAMILLCASCAESAEDISDASAVATGSAFDGGLSSTTEALATFVPPDTIYPKMVVLSSTPIAWNTPRTLWTKYTPGITQIVNYAYADTVHPIATGNSSANSCVISGSTFVCDGLQIYCPFIDWHVLPSAYYYSTNLVAPGWYNWTNNAQFGMYLYWGAAGQWGYPYGLQGTPHNWQLNCQWDKPTTMVSLHAFNY